MGLGIELVWFVVCSTVELVGYWLSRCAALRCEVQVEGLKRFDFRGHMTRLRCRIRLPFLITDFIYLVEETTMRMAQAHDFDQPSERCLVSLIRGTSAL